LVGVVGGKRWGVRKISRKPHGGGERKERNGPRKNKNREKCNRGEEAEGGLLLTISVKTGKKGGKKNAQSRRRTTKSESKVRGKTANVF